jgi:hypothetical protein
MAPTPVITSREREAPTGSPVGVGLSPRARPRLIRLRPVNGNPRIASGATWLDQRRYRVTRCSVCRQTDHSRRTCPQDQQEHKPVQPWNPRWRHPGVVFGTLAQVVAAPYCPRCGGLLLRQVDPGVLCYVCGRVWVVGELLARAGVEQAAPQCRAGLPRVPPVFTFAGSTGPSPSEPVLRP